MEGVLVVAYAHATGKGKAVQEGCFGGRGDAGFVAGGGRIAAEASWMMAERRGSLSIEDGEGRVGDVPGGVGKVSGGIRVASSVRREDWRDGLRESSHII